MDLPLSIDLATHLPKLKKNRWKLRYAIREIINLSEELNGKGWNHGCLTTRSIVFHNNPGWFSRHYFTNFSKLAQNNDSYLVVNRKEIWKGGHVFLP